MKLMLSPSIVLPLAFSLFPGMPLSLKLASYNFVQSKSYGWCSPALDLKVWLSAHDKDKPEGIAYRILVDLFFVIDHDNHFMHRQALPPRNFFAKVLTRS